MRFQAEYRIIASGLQMRQCHHLAAAHDAIPEFRNALRYFRVSAGLTGFSERRKEDPNEIAFIQAWM